MISVILIGTGLIVLLMLIIWGLMWLITWTPRAKSADERDRLTIYFPDGSAETHDCWSITYYDSRRVGYETDSGWHTTSLPFIVEDHQ